MRVGGSSLVFFYLPASLLPMLQLTCPPITPEEQAIKDVAGQPGASAIILQRQEVADDMNNFHTTYKRIKVLNEAARKFADVELQGDYWKAQGKFCRAARGRPASMWKQNSI